MNVALLRGRGEGALAALLADRAARWARDAFPDADVTEVAGDLRDAVASADAELVVVVPEIAVWRPALAAAVRDDLADGCRLSFGPVFDGGLYLLALSAEGLTAVRGADDLDLGGLVDLAEREGFEVGMLQAERGLRSAADLRACAVDPLCDPELRALLG